MIRVLGTELRRSNARFLAILLVVASAATLAGSRDWGQQWLQLSYYMAANVFIQVPLALAAGAMLGRRERRTRAAELLSSTGRPLWQRATPTMLALAVGVVAVQLLTLAVGAVRIGAAGGYLSMSGAAPALADIVVLVGAAWVGLAVGRAWSSPMLPPALAALTLAAQVVASMTGDMMNGRTSRFTSLHLLPQPPNAYWEAATADATLGRLALGLGFVVGSALLLAGTGWLWRTAGVAGVVAGPVLLAVITPVGGSYVRYEVDPAAQRLVCAEGTPEVCVTAVNAHELDEVAAAARQALALLDQLPDAPTRAVEWAPDEEIDPSQGTGQFWGPTPTSEPGTVLFAFRGWLGAPTPQDVTASILNGAGTTMNGCEPGDTVALGAAGAWLMGTDTLPLRDGEYSYPAGMDSEIRATVAALRQLPDDEQVRRVTALRDAANACQGDDLLAILTEGTTP